MYDAHEIAEGYLTSAGGDPERALMALAERALWFAARASGGLIRRPIEEVFQGDCDELQRETAFLAVPFDPPDEP